MKIFEREQMLLKQGREEGREEGRAEGREEERNTERERKRADSFEEENRRLRKEIERLRRA